MTNKICCTSFQSSWPDRAGWFCVIVLLLRWSWKGHSSVILGKIQLGTFIVQVCWETEPYEIVELYSEDGLEKAICWWHWGRDCTCSLLGLPGDRSHKVCWIVLLGRWSWKCCLLMTLGNLPGDRDYWVNIIVLLRWWSWRGNSS